MQRTLRAIRKRYDTIEKSDELWDNLYALEKIEELDFVCDNFEPSILRCLIEMMYTRWFELNEIKRAKEQACKGH